MYSYARLLLVTGKAHAEPMGDLSLQASGHVVVLERSPHLVCRCLWAYSFALLVQLRHEITCQSGPTSPDRTRGGFSWVS